MHIISARGFVHFIGLSTFLHFGQAKSLGSDSSGTNKTPDRIWQPKEGSRAEWMNCHGMPKADCERTRAKYRQLQDVLVPNKVFFDNRPNSSTLEGCILLTEKQIETLMELAKKSKDSISTRRVKKTMMREIYLPNRGWSMPIYYKFDGTHDEGEQNTIRDAFQHWMDNTCVHFEELATDAPSDDHHILITRERRGCYSYVGRTPFSPQALNLDGGCLTRFGTPVHEIGHALGLWHEQMRRDRDSAIKIVWENIYDIYASDFALSDTDNYGFPYNYGSVMQYSAKDASAYGRQTMLALNPLYQMNMGQRTGLSFENIKMINSAYCRHHCPSQGFTHLHCYRGGYQNPNNCSACICPDGFSGQYCNIIAPAKGAYCGGMIDILYDDQKIIKSPGYDDMGYYLSHQECNWWILTPNTHHVLELRFIGEFGLYSEFDACYHWVEIKYKRNLALEGGRFCGNRRPNVTITSQSNEMMIVFRSNYSVNYFSALRGFRVVVKSTST